MDKKYRTLLHLMHSPCSEDNLKKLPLYSGMRVQEVSSHEFHKSYYPDVSVTNLIFNIRARTLLEKADVRTIGDLLLTPHSTLSGFRNCGVKTIDVIQETVKRYIMDKTFNYSVYWYDLESMLRNVLNINKRNMLMFLTRLGVKAEKSATLEECGKQFGITREAVRQIIGQVQEHICHPQTEFKLRPFWALCDKIIKKKEVVTSEELAIKIKIGLVWESKPESHALEQLLALKSNKYMVTFNHLVGFKESKCLNCKSLDGFLDKIMLNRTDITQNAAFQKFLAEFRKSCPQVDRFPTRTVNALNKLYLRRYVSQNPDLAFRNNKIINTKTYVSKRRRRFSADLFD
jgi:hypothetical protein